MANQLTCPGCGAAALPDATRCEFCRGALVRVACPGCMGALFEGMTFCPHCGTRASRSAAEAESAVTCPQCRTPMRVVRVGQTALQECPTCASSWVDTATFVALSTSREDRGAIAAVIGHPTEAAPKRAAGPVRYHPCPLCAKLMNRVNFAKRSGVVVDVCRGHGVWFETHELRQVLEFIESGGLERSRANQRELHEAEFKALRAQLRSMDIDRRGGTRAGVQVSFTWEQSSDATGPLAQILAHLLN